MNDCDLEPDLTIIFRMERNWTPKIEQLLKICISLTQDKNKEILCFENWHLHHNWLLLLNMIGKSTTSFYTFYFRNKPKRIGPMSETT